MKNLQNGSVPCYKHYKIRNTLKLEVSANLHLECFVNALEIVDFLLKNVSQIKTELIIQKCSKSRNFRGKNLRDRNVLYNKRCKIRNTLKLEVSQDFHRQAAKKEFCNVYLVLK